MLFTGSGVAIVTPFNDEGQVDLDQYEKLIEYQIENSTDAIIAIGTTGEASTMTEDEKIQVVKKAVEVAGGRVPVIAGTGCNDTAQTLNFSKKACSLGVDGLLVVTPYYNKGTEKGLYLHFETIAKACDKPIILYNVPGRTNVSIPPKMVAELAKLDNIVGIKDATGDIVYTLEVARLVPEDFAIYSGNDDMIYPIMACGGVGVISVIANILPKMTHDLCQSYLDGNIEESLKLQKDMLPMVKALFIETNPTPVKAAVNIMGLGCGSPRLPLFEAEGSTVEVLTQELKNIGVI